MIHFDLADTDSKIVVTLNEKRTLTDAVICYLIIFTHSITKQVNAFTYSTGDDESADQDRYNQFTLEDVNSKFSNFPFGEYHYTIYQQLSVTNLDPALSAGEVESGKMMLINSNATEVFTTFTEPTTFITYE